MPTPKQIWRDFARRQQKIEKSFIPKMQKAVKGEVKKVTDYIKVNGTQGAASHMHTAFDHTNIKTVISNLWHASVITEATISYKELKKIHLKQRGLGFNKEWNKIIDLYLSDVEKFHTVEQINTTTKKRLLEIISQGIQDGKSNQQIVDDIEADDIPLKRAKLIVRTESVGAMNMGAMIGSMSTGIMYDKGWITAHDHKVRGSKPMDAFSHVELDGQTAHIDKPYNNGEEIRYPGDKSASAGNFCNCRCCQRFIARRDDNGRIMRYGGVQTGYAAGGGEAVPNVFQPGEPQTSVLMQIIAATILGSSIADLFSSAMGYDE
jgi:hypothetical protein